MLPREDLLRWRRAASYLRPHRLMVGLILLLTLGIAGLAALEPLVLKHLFDTLAASPDRRSVVLLLVGLLGLGVIREFAAAVSNWLTWRTRISIHYALTEATVGRLHHLPISFHQKEGVGATMTRLDRGIQGFVTALQELAFNVLPAIVYLGASALVMLKLDWRLGILVLLLAPLPAVIAGLAAPKQVIRERTLLDHWTRIYARFNEVLSGIVTVKSFAMEEAEKRRFLTQVDEANRVVVRGVGFDASVGASQNLVVVLARAAALALGGFLVLRGELTLGTLVAFLGYLGGIFAPVQGLSGAYRTLQTGAVSLEQVFSILDAQDSLADAPDAVEVKELRGAVSFENVSFAYEAPDRPLLRDISFSVEPGQSIALVGASGAGKSTLMALLQRFYDPKSGIIRLDGRDLRELKQTSMRRHIGVVLQDCLLFNESMRANIAYGRPEASQSEIEAAARAANAHDFIVGLPQGYDTVVGERGSRLSAGQRQRVAIARSLLKDPPILILDEPTSALDSESEAAVQEALQRLMRGRTTFSIAHRLSTIAGSDRILVLREGAIVESGTHASLVQQDGYYASLVRRQVQGLAVAGSRAA